MIRFTLAITALAVSAFAAEAPLISLVPAEATVIGGIHVDTTVSSPFGQFILSQVNQGDKHFQEMIAATGFDPRHDLREIVFASAAQQAKGPGLILARGVFNGPQILSALEAKSGGTRTTYAGVDLIEMNKGKSPHALAIAEGSLAIAGDSALVRAALDRRSGAGSTSALAGKASTVSGQFDAWMVTTGDFHPVLSPPRRPGQNGGNKGIAIQGIVETSGGVTFGSVVRFSGEAVTRSDKDAQALVDVLRFFTTLAKMNGSGNRQLENLLPLFDSLDVSAQGPLVKVSFAIPQSDLENLMHLRKPLRAAR